MARLMLTSDKLLGTMGLTALGLLSGLQERTRLVASESLGFLHSGHSIKCQGARCLIKPKL